MPPTIPVPSTTEATPPQSGFAKMSQLPELMAKQKALNGAKKPAFIPNAIKEMSKRGQFYIFNVGPKMQEGNGASYGRMMIPGCPEGREYSDPLIVPGLPHEYYNKEGSTLDPQFHGDGELEDPGFDFACQVILGFTDGNGVWTGKFLSPNGSLEKFGVGIARQWPPTKEEIALAKAKMRKEDMLSVEQARQAHALGKFSSLHNSDECFAAAHRLGLTAATERWMEFSYVAPTEEKKTKRCPECAEEIMFAAKRCRYCNTVFDEKK